MADYIPILDTQVDPDAPITSSLGYQFRDNPIAFREGDVGSPVEVATWHPYNMATISAPGANTGEGVIWDHAVSGNTGTLETPDFEDGYNYRIVGANLTTNGNLTYDLLGEIDGYSGSPEVVSNIIATDSIFQFELIRPWYPTRFWSGRRIKVDGAGNSFDVPVRISFPTAQKVTRLRLAGANLTGGRLILEKKLDPLAGAIS